MAGRREINRMVEAVRDQVEMTGGGHWKMTSPTGEVVFSPSTPSDPRSVHNVRAKLRRAGASLARRFR